MKNKSTTTKGKILSHLQEGKLITQQIAIDRFGHYRLASCIHRLKGEGYNITRTMQKSLYGGRYAEYRMVK